MNSKELKGLYQELVDRLSQVGKPSHAEKLSHNISEVNNINDLVHKISDITKEDLKRFITKLHPARLNVGETSDYFLIQELRSNMHGLIGRIRAVYLPDEPVPYSGSPSNIFTQNQINAQSQSQNQNQNQFVSVIYEHKVVILVSVTVSVIIYFIVQYIIELLFK